MKYPKKPFDVVRGIDVFITQNPYQTQDCINWHQLYNYGNTDVVMGIYGNITDKDKNEKLEVLKYTQKRLDDEFKIQKVTSGDTYCYALSTKLTRTKNKININ